MLIEYYGGETALQLFDRFDLPRLEKLLSQTSELRRDPKEREQEKRAKASAALNEWLKSGDLSEVTFATTDSDGSTRMRTLEQINNFEF